MSQRFTIDGSEALEQHLSTVCDRVLAGVRAVVPQALLEGVALGGGYGRGEGGVLSSLEGDQPYNDLEFFVFIRGSTILNDRRYRAALHHLGEELTPLATIEVEFKILSVDKLRRSEPTMFYYDLLAGHRWLAGDDALFARCDRHRDASLIPLHEGTRLLFNRCSGLLYAKERLQRSAFTDVDADFVGRNIAKARLAMGDVWLVMQGSYHWSCIERQRRLAGLTGERAQALAAHHAKGVAFKLHPKRAFAAEKAALHADHATISALAESLWLELERRRIEEPFKSVSDYARVRQSLCPERSALWNGLCNLRAFGIRGLRSKFRARYPRERLLRALSLLLWGMTGAGDAEIVAECLFCDDGSFPAAVRAYETLWHRFN